VTVIAGAGSAWRGGQPAQAERPLQAGIERCASNGLGRWLVWVVIEKPVAT